MIELGRTNGVTSLFVHRPGPPMAGLTFRVGVADERLTTRGVTHLVEHLALHEAGITDYHANGTTGSSVTSFYVAGSPARVRDFMDLTTRSLTALPMGRLEAERSVLRTEEQRRPSPPDLGIWRHGARGYGVAGYPEWGVASLTPEQVQGWADEWFTADNACLWVVGEQVPDFTFSLPAGEWRAPPAPHSILPQLPSSFSSGRRAVVLQAEVTRSAAASLLAKVLERELYRRLRTENAISYAVEVAYEPVTSHVASLTAYADALEDNEDALVGELLDTLASIAVRGFGQADLDAVRAMAHEAYATDGFDAARVRGAAIDVLFGAKVLSHERLSTELEAVTVDDLAAAADEVAATTLLRVPWGTRADWGGFPEAPIFSSTTVSGSRFAHLDRGDETLYLGPDGASLVSAGGSSTVLFRELEAALVWPDGAIHLIGADGIGVVVEPTLYGVSRERMGELYRQLPERARLLRPARPADQIPQPAARDQRPGSGAGPGVGEPGVRRRLGRRRR